MATNTPSLDDAREAWRAADTRAAFWREHHAEFLEKYPERYVAVCGDAVVAADGDLNKLLDILKARGFDPRRVWVRFITADVRRVMP